MRSTGSTLRASLSIAIILVISVGPIKLEITMSAFRDGSVSSVRLTLCERLPCYRAESGGAPPHSTTQAPIWYLTSRLRLGVRRCSAAIKPSALQSGAEMEQRVAFSLFSRVPLRPLATACLRPILISFARQNPTPGLTFLR